MLKELDCSDCYSLKDHLGTFMNHLWASQMVLLVKNLPANAGDTGLIPGSGRCPGGGHGTLLQYPSLENPMDRGAWQATVHRVKKSQTQLKQLSTHTCIQFFLNFSSREDMKKVQLLGPYQGLQDLTPGPRSQHFQSGTLLM